MDNHSACRGRNQVPPDQEPEGVEPGAPSIDDSSPPIPRKTAVNNVGSQCTWWCWVLPDPRRVVRCPAWGSGAWVATGLRAPLGPGCTSLIEPGFAQFSQGSPPTGLQGLRATRSRRGHADRGPCCVLPIPVRGRGPRAGGPWPVGRRVGGGGRRPRAGRPRCSPVGEATSVLPEGSWWPGTVGVVRCYWPCMRDSVVSMEIASLTRRPRVRVTEVMGSEPIAWNSLSVRSPVGA